MDREKLLKKWQIVTIAEFMFIGIWYFITICYIAYKPELAFNFVNLFMWYVLLCVCAVVFWKIKPEKRRIMPMIISIHDTVEKLKKQRIVLCIISFILCCTSFTATRNQNIILMAISSTWISVMLISNIIKDKIDYLKEKPEGL